MGFLFTTKIIRKPADETVNNSNVLQADDDFKLEVGPNEEWHILIFLKLSSNTTADFKCGWSYPTDCSIWWGTPSTHFSEGVTQPLWETSTLVKETNDYCSIFLIAIVQAEGTAGTVNLMWAQNVANASDTKVLNKSSFVAFKVV